MNDEEKVRLEAFEKMLAGIQKNYQDTAEKMEALKKADKTKTATYRQLFADRLRYQEMLSLYRAYGLME